MTARGASAATAVKDEPGPFFWAALVAPWSIGALGAIWAGVLRWGLHDDAYAWFWAWAILALDVALIVFAYFASRARGRLTNIHATVSMALYTCWQLYAIGTPYFTWRPGFAYLLGWVFVGVSSNMMTIWHRGSGGSEGTMELLRRKVGEVKRLNEIHTKDGRVIATIEMEPGALLSDVKPEVLGSLVGAPRNGTSVVPVNNSLTRGTVTFDPSDRLKTPEIYPGPAANIGADLCKVPARLGVRSSGKPLELYISGDPDAGRNNAHVLAVGMNGAGKSEFYRYLTLDGMARGAAYTYIYANARKADQEPAWMLAGALKVARTKRECIAVLKWVRDEETPRRAKILGEAGFSEWSMEAYRATGLPELDLLLDEISGFAPDAERLLTDLGETLRSLGCRIVAGVQRATGSRLPTDFRAQFGATVAFGCDNDDSAAIALSELQQEAGCAPQAWGNKHPGKCYLDAPGVEDEDAVEPARTFRPNKARMKMWGEALIAWRARGCPADELAHVAARGELAPAQRPAAPAGQPARLARYAAPVEAGDPEWEEVAPMYEEGEVDEVRLDEARLGPDADGYALDEATRQALSEANEDDDADPIDEEAEEMLGGEPGLARAQEALGGVEHRAPLGAPAEGVFIGLTPRMQAHEARAIARQMILGLVREGVRSFKVEDVGADILEVTGFSAQWLSKWLTSWCEHSDEYGPPILRRTDARGYYDIIGNPDEQAA